MNTLTTVLTIIQVIAAILLTTTVLVQTGKSSGLSSAIGGGSSDSFLGKNKSRTWDAKLANATKWIAALFIILTFALCLL